jgi:hypothetical protein
MKYNTVITSSYGVVVSIWIFQVKSVQGWGSIPYASIFFNTIRTHLFRTIYRCLCMLAPTFFFRFNICETKDEFLTKTYGIVIQSDEDVITSGIDSGLARRIFEKK